jgi:hypothetical protein
VDVCRACDVDCLSYGYCLQNLEMWLDNLSLGVQQENVAVQELFVETSLIPYLFEQENAARLLSSINNGMMQLPDMRRLLIVYGAGCE